MKTKIQPVLVLGIIFGFVLMMMSASMVSAQQQAAPAEKPAVKMETQAQTMQTPQPKAKIETSVAQTEKKASSMMKSTGKTAMMSNQQVKTVQEELNKDGYKLAVDGVMGKHTRSAIMDFQQKNQLMATGQLDSATLAKLNLK
jgi:peptidoglycan hydrolase-like protein with peptidoglycan-binding domain